MPQDRYFLKQLYSKGDIVSLSGREFIHLKKVMRAKTGKIIELINGDGQLATCSVLEITKDTASLQIQEIDQQKPPQKKVSLIQAIPRLTRLDVIVEKGTELGMNKLYLFPADKSEKTKISPALKERLEKIAISAIKQCGALYLPEVVIMDPLSENLIFDATVFYGDVREEAKTLISSWQQTDLKDEIAIVIGPEAGFSNREQQLLIDKKAIGVKLHTHILRTDTAPLSALSIIHQLMIS